MGCEWNNDAALSLHQVADAWERARKMYDTQMAECESCGSPCEQQKGCETQLRECAHTLRRALGERRKPVQSGTFQYPPVWTWGINLFKWRFVFVRVEQNIEDDS
jgi:hypothetical protein